MTLSVAPGRLPPQQDISIALQAQTASPNKHLNLHLVPAWPAHVSGEQSLNAFWFSRFSFLLSPFSRFSFVLKQTNHPT